MTKPLLISFSNYQFYKECKHEIYWSTVFFIFCDSKDMSFATFGLTKLKL